MKHVIFGGDGFVGRYLARDLVARGEQVVVADVSKGELPPASCIATSQTQTRSMA
jgi:dTDP-glucose 4,6-dehydratase